MSNAVPQLTRRLLERLPPEWRCSGGEQGPGRLSRAQLAQLVRLLAEVVVEEASRGRVLFPGLGVFRPRSYQARRIVVKGVEHHIPPKTVLTFRAAARVRVLRGDR